MEIKEDKIIDTMYKTSMSADFFTVKGLETRTGLGSYDWNLVLLKELTDNALDAIGAKSQRVEINAFSTEQVLDIIDSKLKKENNLPTINISESLQLDNKALREVAFMRVLKNKFQSQLSKINLPIDLSIYDGKYTMQEAKKAIPEIKEQLIEQYCQEITSKIVL